MEPFVLSKSTLPKGDAAPTCCGRQLREFIRPPAAIDSPSASLRVDKTCMTALLIDGASDILGA